jgi:HAD superfamily hydrolase (TIGR01509 family)
LATKHIIFDCDGVLVDSEPLSMRADVIILKRFGIELTEAEAHTRFVGTTFEAMLIGLTKEFGVEFPVDLQTVKNNMVNDMFRAELKIVAGVKASLQLLASRDITFSVASNSPHQRVELALALTDIRTSFREITTKDEVREGKPAPDVFLRALEKSGFNAEQCIVVEDSATGVTAAVAAGIRTLAFTGTHHEPESQSKKLLTIGATNAFNHMRELPDLVR